jgi:hypothetical protein
MVAILADSSYNTRPLELGEVHRDLVSSPFPRVLKTDGLI